MVGRLVQGPSTIGLIDPTWMTGLQPQPEVYREI
jgi:hypothetical protein